MRDLAIVTLNYNGTEDTLECLESLSRCNTEYTYDVYVLDNDSSINEKELLCNWALVQKDFCITSIEKFRSEDELSGNYLITSHENYGFAKGNNIVVEKIYALYRYVLLLNNDTVVTHDFIQKMIKFMDSDEEVGFASCRINTFYEKDVMWNCGGKLRPWGLRKYFSQKEIESKGEIIEAEFITGCALFVRPSIIEKYGLFTDQFFFGEEDFNYCWRMKKLHIKGKCLTEPLVFHKVSKSSQKVGEKVGKLAGYYVVRTVDMRQFYPYPIWVIWKRVIVFLIGVKWRLSGYPRKTVKKMKKIIHNYSKNKCISKKDMFDVWNM